MTKPIVPSPKTLAKTIGLCIQNADRLIEDAQMLEFEKPKSTRLYLILIAQEELAKAFMLILVSMGVFPLSRPILRAMNDHTCKQLVGMLMEYMIAHWDDLAALDKMIEEDLDMGEDHFPIDIASALDLLRYEKVARWETGNGVYVGDFNSSRAAKEVANGARDRRKQDALYVRVNPDGSAKSTPHIVTDEEVTKEAERASHYSYFVENMADGKASGHRYDKTMAALRLIFGRHPPL
ncbi:AbiV family abortive infection protein [Mesorhizobium sp. YR577]|uniref:AbiV family abortive infection protein n=1 Tax=Mesorhizobium sp. YR577 TaxID=1884373 RepID=UPI0008E4B360|nr:AbiV family abortive infection protein [Mesorhizobium sp. YR577]SFT71334.1 abortive infection protein, AbiV family [Mesorhizobium sp. YR577]